MIDASTVYSMPEVDPDDGFWTQREVLAHIRDFARYRRANPYAVLGSVMRRAVACIEPNVVLPPIVGSVVSVNLYTASVGRSGQGKGVADGAGNDAVTFVNKDNIEIEIEHPNVGTGEGLARLFKGRRNIGEEPPTRAHLVVPEVATLAALAGRQGATLMSELLKAFMGEPLGFTNNSQVTTTAIGDHTYRLSLGVGVQPENAGFFLSREKDGFPQRFLWFPVTDPHAPKVRPPLVEPLVVEMPHFSDATRVWVDVPGTVRDEIDAFRHRVLIGDDTVDPIDGHLMLTRLKAAFALAILNGCTSINVDDWKIAGELIEVSKQVRIDLRAVLDERRRRENREKALDAADREAIIATRLSEGNQQRVAQAITRKLQRDGRATRRALRMTCDSKLRGDFDPVFEMHVDKGLIVSCEDGDDQPQQFRLA